MSAVVVALHLIESYRIIGFPSGEGRIACDCGAWEGPESEYQLHRRDMGLPYSKNPNGHVSSRVRGEKKVKPRNRASELAEIRKAMEM